LGQQSDLIFKVGRWSSNWLRLVRTLDLEQHTALMRI